MPKLPVKLRTSYFLFKAVHLSQLLTKQTRVYNNSATLIDNILTNKVDVEITSGNIISDISDHYSQFCISHNFIRRPKPGKQTRWDISGYSRSKFNSELSDDLVSQTNFSDQFDVDTAFSYFYNTLLAFVDKHAPLKTVSNRKLKQFSKPWITSGLKEGLWYRRPFNLASKT